MCEVGDVCESDVSSGGDAMVSWGLESGRDRVMVLRRLRLHTESENWQLSRY